MNSPAEARQVFESMVAAGRADAAVYLGLASACSSLRDHRAALAAVDQALALQPRNLRALIVKADQLAALGDARAASSFSRRRKRTLVSTAITRHVSWPSLSRACSPARLATTPRRKTACLL